MTRCKNGTRKNKKNGKCEKKIEIDLIKQQQSIKRNQQHKMPFRENVQKRMNQNKKISDENRKIRREEFVSFISTLTKSKKTIDAINISNDGIYILNVNKEPILIFEPKNALINENISIISEKHINKYIGSIIEDISVTTNKSKTLTVKTNVGSFNIIFDIDYINESIFNGQEDNLIS